MNEKEQKGNRNIQYIKLNSGKKLKR